MAALNLQNAQPAPRSAVPFSSFASALLRDLIDYAGLFPPAALDMASSVANYDIYRRSKWSWILGRFIVPMARLNEFRAALDQLPAPTEVKYLTPPWRLSVLSGDNIKGDVACILDFNSLEHKSRSNNRAIVESVEIKVSNPEEIDDLSKVIPPEFETYFEITPDVDECFAAIRANNRRAKIRTGGETADKFPTAHQVVKFIRQCAMAKVAFKATAGLHHPLRSSHNLTYQPQSASGIMHGFLNVFLAAAFVKQGMDDELAVQLLEEQSLNAFRFDSEAIEWRGHRLTFSEVSESRSGFATSFGSCSFVEPIDDLVSLQIL